MARKKQHSEEQTRLIAATHNNHYLFSDYYLNELVIDADEWQKGDGIEKAFKEIKELYDRVKPTIDKANESQTEERFIKPVLEILGHHIEVQTRAPQIEHAKRPDYAFFADEKTKEKAFAEIGSKEYFNYVLAVGDAKSWNRPLDKKIKTHRGDPFTNANPNYQMDYYLRITNKQWGILTNGPKWRLYNRDVSYLLDHYYEVDLVALLEQGKTDEFKYFYLFFRRDALVRDAFLDKAYKQSKDYAVGIEENLKDRVYEALLRLAKGFWEYDGNKITENDLKAIHDNCLIVLYQLLFILNAECRGLLPLQNNTYSGTYSLKGISKEIVGKLESKAELLPSTNHYWSKLLSLFKLIHQGNDHLGITFFDGSLFDLKQHEFLNKYSIGDKHLAEAIDYLCRAKTTKGLAPINYRDLEIRHLGGIYEGILEYKLQLAREDMVVYKEKGKEKYLPLAEANKVGIKFKLDNVIKKGEIYLTTDKGERKATGSYFTPKYIVNYIVENTLGPLVEGKKPKEILELNVLDPAMGSGHFLLGATDFLARAIHEKEAHGEFLSDDEVEDEVNDIRRHVVERCVNGVDINPLAVELAKLTLWLHTMSKGKPLNFLDHNLKCGNSLIGAKLSDLGRFPVLKKRKEKETSMKLPGMDAFFGSYKQDLGPILDWIIKIEYKTTDSPKDIKVKKSAFEYVEKTTYKYRQIADLWVSKYFGNEFDHGIYQDAVDYVLKGKSQLPERKIKEYLHKAQELKEEMKFFHWELEFPEVFFDKYGRTLDNPGFDAVIGNPPYDVLAEKETGRTFDSEINYYSNNDVYHYAIKGKINYFRLFICFALSNTKNSGLHGYIVPMSLMGDDQQSTVRRVMIERLCFMFIEAFPQKDDPNNRVFKDAKLATCLYVIKNMKCNDMFKVRIHKGKTIEEDSQQYITNNKLIEELDGVNCAIPLCSAEEWRLLNKIANANIFIKMSKICHAFQGEINLTTQKNNITLDANKGKLIVRGSALDRYLIKEQKQGDLVYLKIDDYLKDKALRSKAYHHKQDRIIFQRGAALNNYRRLIAGYLNKGEFCSDSLNYIISAKYNLFYVLALLNSILINWRFSAYSTNNTINAYQIDDLPIRHIKFTTQKKERNQLLEGLKELHGVSNSNLILKYIEGYLPKVKKGNLITEKEKSDVVHDFSAFLAEQMIEMNKEKQKEVKSFLEWLEREISAKIDDLRGKTTIKEYYKEENNIDKLIETLKKNKAKLSLDPGRREFQDSLKEEYDKSIVKLKPLLQRCKDTDDLIDRIVYKLYGLTEEEIEIVGQGVKR